MASRGVPGPLRGWPLSRAVPGWTRLAAAAVAGTVLAGVLLGSAQPAHAHDQLVDSSPAAGESLQAPPDEVVLRFSGDLIELGGAILVTDAVDRSWTEGTLVYEGSRARIALKRGIPDGRYEIRWQVVSRDGHPISGIIPFSVGAAEGRPPATPSSTAPAVGPPDLRHGTVAAGSGGLGPGRIVLDGLAGAAVAVGGCWLVQSLVRRRDTRRGTDEPDRA